MRVDVDDDLKVAISDRHARLNPSQAFRLAERLIKAATAKIVTDAADAALVREAVRDPSRFMQ